MSADNPFAAWQQLWQSNSAATLPFMPPASAEEAARKIAELDYIETWLQFQLQAVQSQKALLGQQKAFFDTMQQMTGGSGE
ncbi:MAG: hypothetical protein Q4A62_01740 [Eikenella sp.]|nr:hypothetical protein [Eikenella sp.]